MKVEEIEVPKPATPKFALAPRCQRKVRSTGTGVFNEAKSRCSRVARFEIDGVRFCAQHAGEMALRYLMGVGNEDCR